MEYRRKVTCRPCKEKGDCDIETPNGEVLTRHYQNKYECVSEGRRLAEEYGCELDVQDYFEGK